MKIDSILQTFYLKKIDTIAGKTGEDK